MVALIAKSTTTMSAPKPGTPLLPDTVTGLLKDWNADSLSGTDGSSVTSWVATGPDTLARRSLNKKVTAWTYPMLSLTGGPLGGKAVAYNKTHHIGTVAGNIPGGAPISQPITYGIVCKIDSYASNANARIIGGVAGYLQTVQPGTADGRITFSAATSVTLTAGPSSGSWGVIVVSYNGAASKVRLADGTVATVDLGTNGEDGNFVGGNAQSDPASGGFGGAIKRIKQYAGRAFTDEDILGLHYELATEYGLAA
jgi:hypothetical protein